MKVVSVRIINLSERELAFANDIKVLVGGKEIIPIDPQVIKHKLRQSAPIYLLYSPLVLYFYEAGSPNSPELVLPIGIPIAIGNMGVAATANQKFLNELFYYDLLDDILYPGETKDGIICFYGLQNEPVSFEIKGEDCGEDLSLIKHEPQHSLLVADSIFINPNDSDYLNYKERFEMILKNDPGITEYEFFERKDNYGTLRARGFKARHSYGKNSFFCKIGTWEYSNRKGKLKETINYDLNEEMVRIVKH